MSVQLAVLGSPLDRPSLSPACAGGGWGGGKSNAGLKHEEPLNLLSHITFLFLNVWEFS